MMKNSLTVMTLRDPLAMSCSYETRIHVLKANTTVNWKIDMETVYHLGILNLVGHLTVLIKQVWRDVLIMNTLL